MIWIVAPLRKCINMAVYMFQFDSQHTDPLNLEFVPRDLSRVQASCLFRSYLLVPFK